MLTKLLDKVIKWRKKTDKFGDSGVSLLIIQVDQYHPQQLQQYLKFSTFSGIGSSRYLRNVC